MDPENVTIDIEGVVVTPRGKRILNALMSSGAELFKTARGRLAVHINRNTLAKLQKTLQLDTVDGLDGLKAFAVPADPQKATA